MNVMSMAYAENQWRQWAVSERRSLFNGKRVTAPAFLPHPSRSGFVRPPMAEPDGQVGDWVLSFKDGSRLHLHEMPNGTFLAHRDAIDPSRGLIPALGHWLVESKSGNLVLAAGGIFLAAKLLSSDE